MIALILNTKMYYIYENKRSTATRKDYTMTRVRQYAAIEYQRA
jgi:hypothetical protein